MKRFSKIYMSLLELGAQDSSSEKTRQQFRLINQMTLTMVVIGVPFVIYFWIYGVYYHASVLTGGVFCGASILYITWRYNNGSLSAHFLLVILCVIFSLTNLKTGGFNYAHFSWTYIIPVVAGLLLGRRGMLIYLFIQTGITVTYYLIWQNGIVLPNLFPPEHQAVLALLNRVSAVWTLSIIVMGFVIEREYIEKKLLEAKSEAEQGNIAKSEFLATMSHEIRTPLNGVLGMAELMSTTELSQDQARFLNSIRSSSRSLLAVLNDVLDYSKIEAGKMDIEKSEFNLEQLVNETASLFALRSAESGIELIVYVDPNLPDVYLGDATRIKQVLINLLGNAFKFTEEGEVQLSVLKESGPEQFSQLKFSVKDSGIGISPEKQVTLFESFTQADASTTRKYGGSGLGLAICRRLLTLMGGEIGIESAEGLGSKFWFTLSAEPCTCSMKERNTYAVAGQRIIYADNSLARGQAIQKTLNFYEVDVEIVRSKEGIKAKLSSIEDVNKYSAVVLDSNFSGNSGASILRGLAAIEGLRTCKFILFDDLLALQHNKRTIYKNIDYVIEKPLFASELMSLLSVKKKQENIMLQTMEVRREFDGFNILVVEDNEVNQAVIEGVLEVLDVKYKVAENGEEAIHWLEENHSSCDMVIMDCEMPVMDGMEATRLIREKGYLDTNGDPLPVIALSAHAIESKKSEAYEVGMNYFLTKPVDIEDIAKVITIVARGDVKLLQSH